MVCCSNAKNDWHAAECAPAEHAALAFARSDAAQTCCCGRIGVVTPAGHDVYGAGHVLCCELHVRGVAAVSHVEPCAEQFAHATPFWPHCVFKKPGWHVSFASQQPGHVCGVHVGGFGTHVPPLHVAFCVVQSTHAAPPVPHALFCEPTAHTSPAQQPLGHVCGLHFGGGGMHWPFEHTSPSVVQSVHCIPFTPHALSPLPTAQTFPAQQPLAQFCGLHCGGGPQKPPLHARPLAAQSMHCAPPVPHAVSPVPPMQTPPLQQPFGHVAGPHCVFWHV